jgi:hypothetical protein
MAYARSAIAARDFAVPQNAPRAKRRGVLRRLLDAVEQSNMRRAEREIARYFGGPGAKFTDETEREIERRFLSSH